MTGHDVSDDGGLAAYLSAEDDPGGGLDGPLGGRGRWAGFGGFGQACGSCGQRHICSPGCPAHCAARKGAEDWARDDDGDAEAREDDEAQRRAFYRGD